MPRTGAHRAGVSVNRRDFALLSVIAIIDASSRSGFLLLVPFLMVEKGLPVEHVGFAIMLISPAALPGSSPAASSPNALERFQPS